jgi:hypothetical protein
MEQLHTGENDVLEDAAYDEHLRGRGPGRRGPTRSPRRRTR